MKHNDHICQECGTIVDEYGYCHPHCVFSSGMTNEEMSMEIDDMASDLNTRITADGEGYYIDGTARSRCPDKLALYEMLDLLTAPVVLS